jgi:hypothetical protein
MEEEEVDEAARSWWRYRRPALFSGSAYEAEGIGLMAIKRR